MLELKPISAEYIVFLIICRMCIINSEKAMYDVALTNR